MSSELEIPPIGNKIIDLLRGMQHMIDGISDPERRTAYLREALTLDCATPILGKECYIDSAMVLAKSDENAPDERVLLPTGLRFLGHSISYSCIESQRINHLTMNFSEPEIIGSNPLETSNPEELVLHVPVLSIRALEVAPS